MSESDAVRWALPQQKRTVCVCVSRVKIVFSDFSALDGVFKRVGKEVLTKGTSSYNWMRCRAMCTGSRHTLRGCLSCQDIGRLSFLWRNPLLTTLLTAAFVAMPSRR